MTDPIKPLDYNDYRDLKTPEEALVAIQEILMRTYEHALKNEPQYIFVASLHLGYMLSITTKFVPLKSDLATEDYQPYGGEWRKEMKKFTKDQLIDRLERIVKQEIKNV